MNRARMRRRQLLSVVATEFNITIDRAIGAPGHGKDLVDGLNAMDKIYKMSLAGEAKRLLSDPLRAHGVKGESDKKRQANAKMQERVYHVQDPAKVKYTNLSMAAVGFESGEHNGILAHYNPVMKLPDGSSLNDWRFLQLKPTKTSDAEEEEEAHADVLAGITLLMAEKIEPGKYGAIATEGPEGFYILKFTSAPYTQQEDAELTEYTPDARADLGDKQAAVGHEQEEQGGGGEEEGAQARPRGRRDDLGGDQPPRGARAR
uniref:Uncharacterized protein n=1 Tax=Prymnesium polylepis TaxID=72548 RepID=A0A6T8CRX0_9EUKA|mmetsp:Transcript_65697/g.180180  ORF Transcript_65697/g.180180 Transcript_65697/m.180180 type:complete len:261 (+) Transcript_65697:580-1362(+)